MSSPTPARPLGVMLVAALLLLSGVVGLVGGILGLIGSSSTTSASVEGVALDGTGIALLSGFLLVVAVLNVIFAFGILRGSRAARMIITILQVLTIISGIVGLVTSGAEIWHGIYNLLMPILIVALLWTGVGTREFFAKR